MKDQEGRVLGQNKDVPRHKSWFSSFLAGHKLYKRDGEMRWRRATNSGGERRKPKGKILN